MNECSAYVGLDVHKDAIAVALPVWERGRPARSGPKTRRQPGLARIDEL